jgi:hypothetical protein
MCQIASVSFGAGDLAARPDDPPRTRAGALSPASRPASHNAEEPHPRDADHVGHPCPVSDLFGLAGRDLLDRLEVPDSWRRNVDVSLGVIDDLELQIARLTVELCRHRQAHRHLDAPRSD